jgi:hypothetical protein
MYIRRRKFAIVFEGYKDKQDQTITSPKIDWKMLYFVRYDSRIVS